MNDLPNGGLSAREAIRGAKHLGRLLSRTGIAMTSTPYGRAAAEAALAEEKAAGWLKALCTPDQYAAIAAAVAGVNNVAIKHCATRIAVTLTKMGVTTDDMPHALVATGRLVDGTGTADPLGAAEFVGTVVATTDTHGVHIIPAVAAIARAGIRL